MAIVLFITPKDLKSNTILNGNVDTDMLLPFVRIAQEMHVQNYLGTKLYDAITTKIQTNTLSGNYLTLVTDFIQPMLIHFSMQDFLPFANYQIRSGGVFRHKTDNSDSVTQEELDILIQKHRTFADFYATRFINYITTDGSALFPEYYTNKNSDMFPDTKANPCGFLL